VVAGLDTPSAGRVVLDGEDITHLDERRMSRLRNRRLGIAFQSLQLIPTRTAQEDVEAPLYVGPHRRLVRSRVKAIPREGGHGA